VNITVKDVVEIVQNLISEEIPPNSRSANWGVIACLLAIAANCGEDVETVFENSDAMWKAIDAELASVNLSTEEYE